MPTPLVAITVPSIYGNPRVSLPRRMAKCTPDFYRAIQAISADVIAAGGTFYLSDLYRTYAMQLQAHNDYLSGKKKAYSPAPGGSMHEAGRAMDIDVGGLKLSLSTFWTIAARHGVVPIISSPSPGASESWHFECRGSHQLVYDYYARKGYKTKPAAGMATSAIVAIGQRHDQVKVAAAAQVQSALIRLGFDPGPVDGDIGSGTRNAAAAAGVSLTDLDAAVKSCDLLLAKKFPNEYRLDSGIGPVGLESVGGRPLRVVRVPRQPAAPKDEAVFWGETTRPLKRPRGQKEPGDTPPAQD